MVLKSIAYISVSCGSVVNKTLKSPADSDGFYAASISCVYNTSIPYGRAMMSSLKLAGPGIIYY